MGQGRSRPRRQAPWRHTALYVGEPDREMRWDRPSNGHTTYEDRAYTRPSDQRPVIHGYRWSDLEEAARVAVATSPVRAGDRAALYDEALSAIAEHLVSIPPNPLAAWPASRGELIGVGWWAIGETIRGSKKHSGRPYESSVWADESRRPRFLLFWQDVCPGWSGSHEPRVVDRLAVWQVVDLLPPRRRQVAEAVAAVGDVSKAAAALGVSVSTVRDHLRHIRVLFEDEYLGGRRVRAVRRTDAQCKWGHPVAPGEKCKPCWNAAMSRYRRRAKRQAAASGVSS